MRRRNQYRVGDNLVICDRCGFVLYASESKKTWDGLIVCPDDWEPRHPQDFLRGIKDDQSVRVSRPRPTDIFIETGVAPPPSSCSDSGIAGIGQAGCMIAGNPST